MDKHWVIFGASDFDERKLLPSLYRVVCSGICCLKICDFRCYEDSFLDEEFRIQQKDNLKVFWKGNILKLKQLDAFPERDII